MLSLACQGYLHPHQAEKGFESFPLIFLLMALSLPVRATTVSCSVFSFVAEPCLGLYK